MKAPKCRLCGELHWNREPHRFTKAAPKQAEANPIKGRVRTDPRRQQPSGGKVRPGSKRDRGAKSLKG